MSLAVVREDISPREPVRTLLAIDFEPASLAAAGWDALVGGMSGFSATLSVANARHLLRQGRPSHWLSTIANETEVALMVLDAERVRTDKVLVSRT